MANNYVAKNDYNKGGAHRDLKNDYHRPDIRKEIDEELDMLDEENWGVPSSNEKKSG